MIRVFLISLSVFLISATSASISSENSDLIVYLTWNNSDTSTTMTINYYHKFNYFDEAKIYFDTTSRKGQPQEYLFSQAGDSWEVRGLKRQINSITLKNLNPDRTYYFIVGNDRIGYSKEMKFKTLPNDGRPLKFVTGGDMGSGVVMKAMFDLAAWQSPSAALIGGDIAYADAKLNNYGKWDRFLNLYQNTMITPAGHYIPLILAIGNHESTLFSWEAPFYRDLFRQHGRRTYFKRDLGPYANVYVLDSGHGASHRSQNQWLRYEMERDEKVKHKMALYHAPLYPSHRDYDEFWSLQGRANWGPIFDRFNLKAAFENHDHSLKRTKHIKSEEVVESGGTVYFGDGCWGTNTREVSKDRWYLEKALSKKHFWIVEVSKESIRSQAMGLNDLIYDDYTF